MATAAERGKQELIEGEVGPFYVALNRATFFLVGAVFFSAIPLVMYAVRDISAPIAIAVAVGIGLESGTIVHILIERVMKRRRSVARVAHGIVAVGVAALALTFLLS